MKLSVNGEKREGEVDIRTLLVDLLREEFGLTGTHIGCLTGNCGACTVMLDGLSVKSCTVLAAQADGSKVLTIEGLAALNGEGRKLHPIQEAFIKHHGLQCGYCTPGMILSAYQLLSRKTSPTEQEIKVAISGNLCRCTGYQNITKAIQAAAKSMPRRKSKA